MKINPIPQYVIIFASLTLASSAAYAINPAQGWYAGAIGGGTLAQTFNFVYDATNFFDVLGVTVANGTTINVAAKYKVGWDAGAQLGYRYKHFRGELEFLASGNRVSTLTGDGITLPITVNRACAGNTSGTTCDIGIGSHSNFYTGLLNAYYDFFSTGGQSDGGFVPYVGVGVGYAQDKSTFTFSEDGQTCDKYTQYLNNSGVAYQGIIGLNYFVDDDTSFGLDYRYMSVPGIDGGSSNTSGTFSSSNRFQVNTLNATLNFAFDSG